MNKQKITLLVIASLLGLMPCAAFAQGTVSEAERKKLLDLYHAMEGEVLFYGKVVDQHGDPVVGASVEVSVPVVKTTEPMSYDKKSLLTDEGGNFEVSSKTYGVSKLMAQHLYIDRITNEGYVGDWYRGTNKSFSFSTDNSQRFRADASKPVIYQLRKTGTTAFLFHYTHLDLGLPIAESGSTVGCDFIKGHRLDDARKLVFNDEPVFPDIKLKATFNTNDATWTVVVSPGNTNGGIIASEQLLYEAPESGYQAEYVFTPESDRRKPIIKPYLYLKSREPAIYTRIDIKNITAIKKFFQLSGESVTNPYGERNLERATDLPFEVSQRLKDEARAAFRANKRPVKPDLSKLVLEAKSKTRKDKR